MEDIRNFALIKQFFRTVPTNESRLFARVIDPFSGCKIFFPCRTEETLKKQKAMIEYELNYGFKSLA